MSAPVELPSTADLSYWQYQGWDCVWCGKRLTTGAVSAGIARGSSGDHVFDTEVWACPEHPNGLTETTATGDAS